MYPSFVRFTHASLCVLRTFRLGSQIGTSGRKLVLDAPPPTDGGAPSSASPALYTPLTADSVDEVSSASGAPEEWSTSSRSRVSVVKSMARLLAPSPRASSTPAFTSATSESESEREPGGWLARVPASVVGKGGGAVTRVAVTSQHPRMPWHDVAVALGPGAAVDVATHFIQVYCTPCFFFTVSVVAPAALALDVMCMCASEAVILFCFVHLLNACTRHVPLISRSVDSW